MRRLNKEISSKDELLKIEGQLKISNFGVFRNLQAKLLRKAMQGSEKSKMLLQVSLKHSKKLYI